MTAARRPVTTCALCGLARGNGRGIPVYKYPLIRGVRIAGRSTTRCIGSLPACDRCLVELGVVKRAYRSTPR